MPITNIPRSIGVTSRDILLAITKQNPHPLKLMLLAYDVFQEALYLPLFKPFEKLMKIDITDCSLTIMAINQIFLNFKEYEYFSAFCYHQWQCNVSIDDQAYTVQELISSQPRIDAFKENFTTLDVTNLYNQTHPKIIDAFEELYEVNPDLNFTDWDFNLTAFQTFKREISLNLADKGMHLYNIFLHKKLDNENMHFFHVFTLFQENQSFKLLNSWKDKFSLPQDYKSRLVQEQAHQSLAYFCIFLSELENIVCRSSNGFQNFIPTQSLKFCFGVDYSEEDSPYYLNWDDQENILDGITFYYTSHEINPNESIDHLNHLIEKNSYLKTMLFQYASSQKF